MAELSHTLNVPIHWGIRPHLLPGERLLKPSRLIWLCSGKAWPYTYRIAFPLPPLAYVSLYITDRRVIIQNVFFCVAGASFSMWYKPTDSPYEDVVTNVRSGRLRLNTPYVEILSQTESKTPLRTKDLRIRIFTREAKALEQVIRGALPPAGNT